MAESPQANDEDASWTCYQKALIVIGFILTIGGAMWITNEYVLNREGPAMEQLGMASVNCELYSCKEGICAEHQNGKFYAAIKTPPEEGEFCPKIRECRKKDCQCVINMTDKECDWDKSLKQHAAFTETKSNAECPKAKVVCPVINCIIDQCEKYDEKVVVKHAWPQRNGGKYQASCPGKGKNIEETEFECLCIINYDDCGGSNALVKFEGLNPKTCPDILKNEKCNVDCEIDEKTCKVKKPGDQVGPGLFKILTEKKNNGQDCSIDSRECEVYMFSYAARDTHSNVECGNLKGFGTMCLETAIFLKDENRSQCHTPTEAVNPYYHCFQVTKIENNDFQLETFRKTKMNTDCQCGGNEIKLFSVNLTHVHATALDHYLQTNINNIKPFPGVMVGPKNNRRCFKEMKNSNP